MYDGNVAIYNLQHHVLEPIYLSKGVNGKHGECVWEVSILSVESIFPAQSISFPQDQMGTRYARWRNKFLFSFN